MKQNIRFVAGIANVLHRKWNSCRRVKNKNATTAAVASSSVWNYFCFSSFCFVLYQTTSIERLKSMTLIGTNFSDSSFFFSRPKIPNPKLLLMNSVFASYFAWLERARTKQKRKIEERKYTWLSESVKNKENEREKNRMNEKVIQKLVTKCKQNKMNEFDSRSVSFRSLPFIVFFFCCCCCFVPRP